MLVRDLNEDLCDGQILKVFLEKLLNESLPNTLSTPATSDRTKKGNLDMIVTWVGNKLDLNETSENWSTMGIVKRDFGSICCFLVDIARKMGCPYPIPSDVSIPVVRKEFTEGVVKTSTLILKITNEVEPEFEAMENGLSRLDMNTTARLDGSLDELKSPLAELQPLSPDVFDALSRLPGKFLEAQVLVTQFVNKHLEPLDISILESSTMTPAPSLEEQVHDGVLLILLLGVLGNIFVPLEKFFFTPRNVAEKLENVKLAFKLMEELGYDVVRLSAGEFVRGDPTMILRCFHTIASQYRNIV